MTRTLAERISDIIRDTWPAMRMSDAAATNIVRILGVLPEIADERERQDERWGEQNHPDGTGPGFAIDAKRARHSCNLAASLGLVSYRDILNEEVFEAFAESDPDKLRHELVQVAAVTVAWIEKLDRERAASTK
ncbi:hypothetical protein ACFVWF_32865 [Rhodococcus qingshengii]|uniref:hypothetical protein n=1 Tax=Rhodococcus qingshengii TaxID=334542 RepID=UPI0036DAB880